jgi:hypothetical protein
MNRLVSARAEWAYNDDEEIYHLIVNRDKKGWLAGMYILVDGFQYFEGEISSTRETAILSLIGEVPGKYGDRLREVIVEAKEGWIQ